MGLVGPKARPKGVTDGQQVNIPALPEDRQRVDVESSMSLCPHHTALVQFRVTGFGFRDFSRNSQLETRNFVRDQCGVDMFLGKESVILGAV